MNKQRTKPNNPAVTRHAVGKYVDRIVCPEGDNRAYITNNYERLEKEIKKMFEYSDFIYRGQILKNLTQSFYLHKDVAFVVDDVKDNKIITLYEINFPFPAEANRAVIDSLISNIKARQGEIESDFAEYNALKEEMESKNDLLKKEIETLEEQIETLRMERSYNEDTVELALKKVQNKNSLTDQYADQLFGNTGFKKEAKSMMNEWK